MYFDITKAFLSARTKRFLLHTFIHKKTVSHLNKKEIIDRVFKQLTPKIKNKPTVAMLSMCEFCRTIIFVAVPKEVGTSGVKYCIKCGRMSSQKVFRNNIERSKKLLNLASKMNTKKEKDDKAILIEQTVVSLATSAEVLLRESYSVIIDFRHVIFGKSIYETTYKNSKNDFTNIGISSSNFKKMCNLNLKTKIGDDRFTKIRLLYSIRHAIVHNNAIKDAEFISQTNGQQADIRKKIKLTVTNVRKFISALNTLGILINLTLKDAIIDHLEERSKVISTIKSKPI